MGNYEVNRERSVLNNYLNKYYQLRNLNKLISINNKATEHDLKIDSLLNIYIEPTNRCNLKCIFCARESMNRDLMDLTIEQFQHIIDPLPSGTHITMTGNGEPLLNNKIYDMIRLASERGLLVSIITNGTAVTEKNSRKLIESGISRVQFSFDSINKETYEATRTGARYNDVLLKILKFILIVRKEYVANIFISILSVQTERVKQYATESRTFWNSLPIDNYYESPVYSLQTDSKAYDSLSLTEEAWKTCITPFVAVKVDADGAVTPCPQDFSGKYIIGNCNNEDIFNILNAPKAIEFRRALYEGNASALKNIGYNCFDCNAWRSGIGYGLNDYILDTFPIIMSRKLIELNKQFVYSDSSINNLEKIIDKLGKN